MPSVYSVGTRASRYGTSATKKGAGRNRSYGNDSHPSIVNGPNERSSTGASYHHGERNHWLKYGNTGLPKCVHRTTHHQPIATSVPAATPAANHAPSRAVAG